MRKDKTLKRSIKAARDLGVRNIQVFTPVYAVMADGGIVGVYSTVERAMAAGENFPADDLCIVNLYMNGPAAHGPAVMAIR